MRRQMGLLQLPAKSRWARLLFPRTYMDRQRRAGFLFVLPAVGYFACVYFIPLIESLLGSFYRPLPGGASRVLGFGLYERVFTGPVFCNSVRETINLPALSAPSPAAPQATPEECYEAAAMAGASARQQLWDLTLPLLNPQVVMVCILELIFNFKIFDQVYATTQGGPAGASQTIIPLLYDTAFKFFRLGEASVMAVFVFGVLLVVTLLQWRIFPRPVDY